MNFVEIVQIGSGDTRVAVNDQMVEAIGIESLGGDQYSSWLQVGGVRVILGAGTKTEARNALTSTVNRLGATVDLL